MITWPWQWRSRALEAEAKLKEAEAKIVEQQADHVLMMASMEMQERRIEAANSLNLKLMGQVKQMSQRD